MKFYQNMKNVTNMKKYQSMKNDQCGPNHSTVESAESFLDHLRKMDKKCHWSVGKSSSVTAFAVIACKCELFY